MFTSTRLRLAIAPLLAAGLALGLTACGGGSGSGGQTEGTPAPSRSNEAGSSDPGGQGGGQGGTGGPGGPQQFREPGVRGRIAAWSGNIAQVQDAATQTAVTVLAGTAITEVVGGSMADVKVGACVLASAQRPAMNNTPQNGRGSTPNPSPSGRGGAAPAPGGAGGIAPSIPSSLTAVTVRVEQPAADGTCTGTSLGTGRLFNGAPGTGGDTPHRQGGGRPTDLPSGAPTDLPSGAPGGAPDGGVFRFAGFAVVGTVTEVTGSTFKVKPLTIEGRSTTVATVKTTESTEVSVVRKTTAAAIKVGLCASAQGESDNRGGLKATTLQLSTPDSTGCVSRMVLRGNGTRGGPGGGQAGGPNGSSA